MRRKPTDSLASDRAAFSLVWVDRSPERKQLLTRCQNFLRKLKSARRLTARFHEKDLKAFESWHARVFASVLKGQGELRASVRSMQDLVARIRTEVRLGHCSYREAFERVKNNQTHSQDEQDSKDSKFRDQAQEDDQLLRGLFEDFISSASFWPEDDLEYQRLFEQFKKDYFTGNLGGGDRNKKSPSENESTTSKKSERDLVLLKQAYRRLAQMLHPDLNPDLNERSKELWLEVQSAYRAKDLNRLLALESFEKIEGGNLSADDVELPVLSRLLLQIKSEYQVVRADLERFKKFPSWDFAKVETKSQDLLKLHRMLQFRLGNETRVLTDQVFELRQLLQKWDSQPREKRARASRPATRSGTYRR